MLPELLQVNCDVVLALFRDVKKLHTAQMTAESLIDRCVERASSPPTFFVVVSYRRDDRARSYSQKQFLVGCKSQGSIQ